MMDYKEAVAKHEKLVSKQEKRFNELKKSFEENPQFDLCRDVIEPISYSKETHTDYFTVLALLNREFKYLTKLETLNILRDFQLVVDEMLYIVAKSFMLQLGNDIFYPVVTEEGEPSSKVYMLNPIYTPAKRQLDDIIDNSSLDDMFDCLGSISLTLSQIEVTPKVAPFNNTYKYPRDRVQTRPDKWALLNTLAAEIAEQFNSKVIRDLKNVYAQTFTHSHVPISAGSFAHVLNSIGDAMYNLSGRGGVTTIIAHDHVLQHFDLFNNSRFEGTTFSDLHLLRTTTPGIVKAGTFMGVKILADHHNLAEDEIIAVWANEAIDQERPVVVGMGIPLLINNNFGEISLASEYVCIGGNNLAMFIGKVDKFKLDPSFYVKRSG